MKKLFYMLVLVVVACVSLASCTEEIVKPKESTGAGSAIKE
jgi:hypothetical protein